MDFIPAPMMAEFLKMGLAGLVIAGLVWAVKYLHTENKELQAARLKDKDEDIRALSKISEASNKAWESNEIATKAQTELFRVFMESQRWGRK